MAGRWTFVLVIALACAMVTAKLGETNEPAAKVEESRETAGKTNEPAKVEESKETALPNLFEQVLKQKEKLSSDEISAYFNILDTHQKGAISLEEFTRNLFDQLDQNSDGKLSKDEFFLAYSKNLDTDQTGDISFHEFERTAKQLFGQLEQKGYDKLSEGDFLIYFKNLKPAPLALPNLYKQLDQDMDSKVSSDEISAYLKTYKWGEIPLYEFATNLYTYLDQNDDGKLSGDEFLPSSLNLAEFYPTATRLFTQLDQYSHCPEVEHPGDVGVCVEKKNWRLNQTELSIYFKNLTLPNLFEQVLKQKKKLSSDDISAYFNTLDLGTKGPRRSVDSHQDGVISLLEFTTNLFRQLDQNWDGKLSKDEFFLAYLSDSGDISFHEFKKTAEQLFGQLVQKDWDKLSTTERYEELVTVGDFLIYFENLKPAPPALPNLYEQLDRDRDSKLSSDEISGYFKTYQHGDISLDEFAKNLFTHLDQNSDGKLSGEEFLPSSLNLDEFRGTTARKLFRQLKLDQNSNDGRLSEDELSMYFKKYSWCGAVL